VKSPRSLHSPRRARIHPIRAYLALRGESLRDLGRQARIDPTLLSRIEHGLRPTRGQIDKLTRVSSDLGRALSNQAAD